MGEKIRFKRPDGQELSGYLAMPREGKGAPGVVVVHEWWGMGSPKERAPHVADRLAEAGFRALVPDLFRGKHTTEPAEADRLMKGIDFADAVDQDLRGAVQHLKAYPGAGPRVGVMGFCMGGALAMAAAGRVPELDVAVTFYGIPPRELADPAQIRVNFQSHWANEDEWCTPDAVTEVERRMRAGGVVYELYRYDARHAFMNDVRKEAYNAKAAQEAWDRAVPFLRRALGTSHTGA
jgi:carboxymethylenebutenolidase